MGLSNAKVVVLDEPTTSQAETVYRTVTVSYTHLDVYKRQVDTVLLPMMVFVHVNPKERMEVLSFSTVSRYMVMLSLIHI